MLRNESLSQATTPAYQKYVKQRLDVLRDYERRRAVALWFANRPGYTDIRFLTCAGLHTAARSE